MQIIMICKYKTEQEEAEECGWGSLTGSSKVAANKEQEKKVKGKKRWHEEEARYADRREKGKGEEEQGEVGKGSANK